jgi:AcrR family transcriptional regulator
MGVNQGSSVADAANSESAASDGKAPRTARGAKTLRKILDAARAEFGERGFADSSIVTITTRAGVALGTFYTYFDSKEAVFQALVRDMSGQVRDYVAPALNSATGAIDGERRALQSFLEFARAHRDVYRIVDESEFVEPASYREHYETTASRIATRLRAGRDKGEIDGGLNDSDIEILAWALMGANVFLGLRFAVWDETDPRTVARVTERLLTQGIAK